MSSQQAQINGIIVGMKRAVNRRAYDSDSDSSIEHLTNRGNKLRKKARFVHEGQLAAPTGSQIYKKTIEHGGYYRDVISLNPALVDQNGRLIDTDDEDERKEASLAEFDPYAETELEHLLAPLMSVSDLPNHPSLKTPFESKALTELARHAGEMVQKEKAALWRIKHLLTRLSGDNTWMPCESVETDKDYSLFLNNQESIHVDLLGKAMVRGGDQISTGTLASEDIRSNLLQGGIKQLTNVPSQGPERELPPQNESPLTAPGALLQSAELSSATNSGEAQSTEIEMSSGDALAVTLLQEAMDVDNGAAMEAQSQVDEVDITDGIDDSEEPAPRRMRTRAQAQAASDNTTSSRARSNSPFPNEETSVSPYFLAPLASRPDRDFGLPIHEADDMRKLVQIYIQKQEEVCRGAEKLYDGLMRADRYRNLVMKWAKAEGHVGAKRDMSDGEDWYDKEEWGLDEDLKKGQDEEEEDAATTAKKTRTRRQ